MSHVQVPPLDVADLRVLTETSGAALLRLDLVSLAGMSEVDAVVGDHRGTAAELR